MYELRAGAVGFRLASLPLLLSVSTTALKVLNVDKTRPNDSRNNKTLNNKTKTQGESFLFLFLSKKWVLGRILFIFIHSVMNSGKV